MKVSVLVPVYNKTQKELTRCFESILKQTYKNIELIITDDGSNPEIASFLDNYTEQNKTRITGGIHCYHYPNSGVWTARNRGQEKASGDWIMHINADDFILPVTIATALEAVNKYENADMVYWGFRSVDFPPYLYNGFGGDTLYTNPTKERFHIRQKYLYATPFCDVSCMVRSKKALLFNTELTGVEFEHQARMIAGCHAVYFIDRPFYNYVNNDNTITKKVQEDISWSIAVLKDSRDALIANNFKITNEYLIPYARNIMYRVSENKHFEFRESDRSFVEEIIRSESINEVTL